MAEWWQTYFDDDYFLYYTFDDGKSQGQVDFVVEVMGLAAGDRVLDLCCGHGRHAIPLAERGMRVTGLDLSEVFIDRARAAAAARGVEVEFIRSDMREIPFTGEFDAVINLFTAFGYFDEDAENERVFGAVANALRPGGRFLIDVLSPLWLARVYFPKHWQRNEETGALILEERGWDHMLGRSRTRRTLITDERRREDEFSLRLYTLPELRAMAERVGLEPVAAYGGYDASPYSHTTNRLILLAQKPKGG
jgi:SAM-dependent methyltransferase